MMDGCYDVCYIVNCYGITYTIERLTGITSVDCSTIEEPVYSIIDGGKAIFSMKSKECKEALIMLCDTSGIMDGDIMNIAGGRWRVVSVIEYPSHIEATLQWAL